MCRISLVKGCHSPKSLNLQCEREGKVLPCIQKLIQTLTRGPGSKASIVNSDRKGRTLFTNFDQVSHNVFFPQKTFWVLWKLPQQLSTPDCDPLTAVKRKFSSYLFRNLEGSFSVTFYFLQGEGSCSSELCSVWVEKPYKDGGVTCTSVSSSCCCCSQACSDLFKLQQAISNESLME